MISEARSASLLLVQASSRALKVTGERGWGAGLVRAGGGQHEADKG
jgi:hypothetical protein